MSGCPGCPRVLDGPWNILRGHTGIHVWVSGMSESPGRCLIVDVGIHVRVSGFLDNPRNVLDYPEYMYRTVPGTQPLILRPTSFYSAKIR